MKYRYRTPSPHTRFRSIRRYILTRPLIILTCLLFIQQQRLFWTYRNALLAKYSPTLFPDEELILHSQAPDPSGQIFQAQLLHHREEWRILGQGYEGKTFTCNGSVIKTFTQRSSPFRNCQAGERYPTEIPASIRFGGIQRPLENDRINTTSRFLPVQSWFQIPSPSHSTPQWHLVTPLVKGGTLKQLAEIHEKQANETLRSLDALYRPSLHHLLQTLSTLHTAGYCHDDVKLGNIFVADPTSWILGDLGNLRHVSHPYHSSRIWLSDNAQQVDCRANDVVRLLKTYLRFIRQASSKILGENGNSEFDETFYDAKEPLIRLYWWSMVDASALSVEELEMRSRIETPERYARPTEEVDTIQTNGKRFEVSGLRARTPLSTLVKKELIAGFALSELRARIWGMVPIFGYPAVDC